MDFLFLPKLKTNTASRFRALIVFKWRHPFLHLSDGEAFLSSSFLSPLSFLPFVCITQWPLVRNNDSQPQLLADGAAFAFLSFLCALNNALPCD